MSISPSFSGVNNLFFDWNRKCWKIRSMTLIPISLLAVLSLITSRCLHTSLNRKTKGYNWSCVCAPNHSIFIVVVRVNLPDRVHLFIHNLFAVVARLISTFLFWLIVYPGNKKQALLFFSTFWKKLKHTKRVILSLVLDWTMIEIFSWHCWMLFRFVCLTVIDKRL